MKRAAIPHLGLRLRVMNMLEFGVWGAYLTSMGGFLSSHGMASRIGIFYAMQGIVSLFMPALMGMIADRWVAANRLLGICHSVAAMAMGCMGWMAMQGADANALLALYTLSVAFYMPTLALSYSVAYSSLELAEQDPIKAYPPIRVWGTVGFICAMLVCDFAGWQQSAGQFLFSAALGLALGAYCFTLPTSPTSGSTGGWKEIFGIKAFRLFRHRDMALFFLFSMLLGVALQITNGFANPFISSFKEIEQYASSFGANHANALISISQISETLCILLIPFAMGRWGIKRVMLIAMVAWVLRFALFAMGNPAEGVWMFVLSMVVYGVAFDFFNVSGSLYVNHRTDESMRSSAQGMFMFMTNGIGATIGTLAAQAVVNACVYSQPAGLPQIEGWRVAWLIFAAYAAIVAIAFALLFKNEENAINNETI